MDNVCGECLRCQRPYDMSHTIDWGDYRTCEAGHGLRRPDEQACPDFIDKRCPGFEPKEESGE